MIKAALDQKRVYCFDAQKIIHIAQKIIHTAQKNIHTAQKKINQHTKKNSYRTINILTAQ